MILFWTGTLALLLLLYMVLDGADLGVGILFGFNRDEEHRRLMLSAITPVWDGNETWLVLTAAVLFPRWFASRASAHRCARAGFGSPELSSGRSRSWP